MPAPSCGTGCSPGAAAARQTASTCLCCCPCLAWSPPPHQAGTRTSVQAWTGMRQEQKGPQLFDAIARLGRAERPDRVAAAVHRGQSRSSGARRSGNGRGRRVRRHGLCAPNLALVLILDLICLAPVDHDFARDLGHRRAAPGAGEGLMPASCRCFDVFVVRGSWFVVPHEHLHAQDTCKPVGTSRASRSTEAMPLTEAPPRGHRGGGAQLSTVCINQITVQLWEKWLYPLCLGMM